MYTNPSFKATKQIIKNGNRADWSLILFVIVIYEGLTKSDDRLLHFPRPLEGTKCS